MVKLFCRLGSKQRKGTPVILTVFRGLFINHRFPKLIKQPGFCKIYIIVSKRLCKQLPLDVFNLFLLLSSDPGVSRMKFIAIASVVKDRKLFP